MQDGTLTVDFTSPQALLVRKDGDTGDVLIVDTTNSQVKVYDQLGIGKVPATGTALDVSGNTAMSGNVGVGSTSPAAAIDVAGTAQLRGAAGQTGLVVTAAGFVGAGTTAP